METVGWCCILMADSTGSSHFAGYCVCKGYCELGKRAYQREKAIDNNKEALENYKKAMLDSQQAAQEEIVQLNLLYQAAVDSSKGMNERISAVKELKKNFLNTSRILVMKRC